MTISNVVSVTPTSATLRDGCVDELNNNLIIVESTTPTLRKYNMTTGVQSGLSYGTSSSPSCVELVAPGVAAIGYSGTSVIDFMDISTGFRLSGAAGTTTSTVKGQLMAADLSLQMGFMTSSTSRQFFRFDYAAGGTVQSFTNTPINASSQYNAIILKSTGRWLLGTTAGQVVEIDRFGQIIDIADFGSNPNSGNLSVSTNSVNSIMYMSYSDNLLLLSWTNGSQTLIDWSTKTVIGQREGGGTSAGVLISTASSGVCISSRSYTVSGVTSNCIFETNFTTGGMSESLPLFTDQTSSVFAGGFNTQTGRGWALQSTPRIRFFDVAPRDSTTVTLSYQPLGSHVQARALILDRTGGTCAPIPLLDTFFQSPGTYRLPTGKTILGLYQYGEGADALFHTFETTT